MQNFNNLQAVQIKFDFSPEFKTDVSGVQIFLNKLSRHVEPTYIKGVAELVSSISSQMLAFASALNAMGHFIHNFLISTEKYYITLSVPVES